MKKQNKITLALTAILVCAPMVWGEGLRPVSNKKGKWGYEDSHGNVVIKYNYAGASEFDEGVAHVLSGKKYGIINEQGEYVVKPDYDVISPFNRFGVAQVTKGNKNGFVDRTGKFVIPVKYAYVGDFNSEGVVWVNEGGSINKADGTVKNGEFTLFRSDGSNLFDDSFATIGTFAPFSYSYTDAQKDKLSLTERQLLEGEKYVFWKRFRYAFKPGKSVSFSTLGLWASYKSDGTYNGIYSLDGKEIVPAGKYYVVNRPSDGISTVLVAEKNYNFLDIVSGGLLLDSAIEDAWAYKNGYCIGKKKNLQYIFDKKGKQCSAGYTKIYPANSGVHVVRNGADKYGLISESGDVIFATTNYSVYPFTGGASLVKPTSKSKAGYVGKNGEWIIPSEYDYGLPFDGQYAVVSQNGKWGMVDKNNRAVIPFEFQTISKGDKGKRLFWVKRENNDKYELFDVSKGGVIESAKYGSVYPFDDKYYGISLVNTGKGKETWGWIGKAGQIVVPLEYSRDLALKAGREFINLGSTPWDDYQSMMFRLRNDSKPVGLGTTVSEERWDF